MKSNLLALTAAAVLGSGIVLTGCGGSSSSNNSGSDEPQLSEVNATEANATAANGESAIELIIEGPGGEAILDAVVALLDNPGFTGQLPTTLMCDNNGTAYLDGTIAVTGADMTATFDGCALDGQTFDGEVAMTMTGDMLLGIPTYAEVTFPTAFSITDANGSTYEIAAGSNLAMDFTAFSATGFAGTQSGSMQWSVDGMQGRYDDLTIVFDMNDTGGTQCYTGGTLYINDLNETLAIDPTYDVDCFVFDANGTLTDGSMRLVGADGGMVDVNVTADNNLSITGTDGILSLLLDLL